MQPNKVLPLLWGTSVSIIVFQSVRSTDNNGDGNGFYPLPPTLVQNTLGWFGISVVAALFSEVFAAWLAAGLILAQLLSAYQNGTFGGKGGKPKLPVLGFKHVSGRKPGQGNGAQFWGNGQGFIYDPLPIMFERDSNSNPPASTTPAAPPPSQQGNGDNDAPQQPNPGTVVV